jgi:hypothetical protein
MAGKPKTGMRRTVIAALGSTGVAVAIALGSAVPANADVIDDLSQEFRQGAGGGQVSNLLDQTLKLRATGYKPTGSELAGIQDALKYRPNQTPLIRALQNAIDGQTHRMQQAQAAAGQSGYTIGINQYNPSAPGGVTAGPGGINVGGGAWSIGGQPGTRVGPAG